MTTLSARILLQCSVGSTPAKEESEARFLARVTHFNLQHRRLTSLDGIESCSGIKYLYAYGNRITCFPSTLASCPALTGAYLDENEIESLDGVEDAPNLVTLLLGHNALQVVTTHLTACTGLRELSLSHQRLPPGAPLHFEAGVLSALASSLTSLDVSGCALTSFAPFGVLQRLERFIATDNFVHDVEEGATLVARLPSLVELDVRRNLLTATAGPGAAYRSVLLAAAASPSLALLDGKVVSSRHMRFIAALTARRGMEGGGGSIGSSLLPVRGGPFESRAGRSVSTHTGRMSGDEGSFLGPSPAPSGSERSPRGDYPFASPFPSYAEEDGGEALVDSDGPRMSGRFAPSTGQVMRGARGGGGQMDPIAAAAAYAALRSAAAAPTAAVTPGSVTAPRALLFAQTPGGALVGDDVGGGGEDAEVAEDGGDRGGEGEEGGGLVLEALGDTLPRGGGGGMGVTHITEGAEGEEEEGGEEAGGGGEGEGGVSAGESGPGVDALLDMLASRGRLVSRDNSSRGGDTGRPPLHRPPSEGPPSSSSAQEEGLATILVPLGNGRTVRVPVPPPDESIPRVGTASGFASNLRVPPVDPNWINVRAPVRTPHDFTRGARFRDSSYVSTEDLRSAAAHATAVLFERGVARERGGGTARMTFDGHPRPEDWLVGGLLATYVGRTAPPAPDLVAQGHSQRLRTRQGPRGQSK